MQRARIEMKQQPSTTVALRQHRLPRFWLGLTLGLVMAVVGGVFWWERQLPARLQAASDRGDLDACLRYSEQLQALRRLHTPQLQGECRRRKATQLWQEERWRDALLMQLQLVNSPAGEPTDRRQLEAWQESLKLQALDLFQAGKLERSLALLQPMGEHHQPDGTALGDQLRHLWERNRLGVERAKRLVDEQRWWEALETLNRLDHPWWRDQAKDLEEKVQQAITSLSMKDREHDSHGSLPNSVPMDALDREVRQRIEQGMNDWNAFQAACQSLGGKVVEAGPDTTCQR